MHAAGLIHIRTEYNIQMYCIYYMYIDLYCTLDLQQCVCSLKDTGGIYCLNLHVLVLEPLIKLDVPQVAFEKILQASEGRWQVWQEIEDMSISDFSSTMFY